MDSGLARALLGAALVVGLALEAWEAPAQLTNQPPLGPPPAGPPPADGSPPPAAPGPVIPVAPAPPPVVAGAPPPSNATNAAVNAPVTPPPPPPVAKPPAPPPEPPPPARTPTAVMQVLDKVTAETLQFEAPIGRAIRYKTLVMTVKVCETRGAQDPQPRPSAYVTMETRAPSVPGHEPPAPKRVFDGWMFANAPALHPLEHPIYDAWLVSCSAITPVARPPAPPPAPAAATPAAAKPSAPPAPVPNSVAKPAAPKPPAPKPPAAKPPTPPASPAPAPENAPVDNSTTPPQ